MPAYFEADRLGKQRAAINIGKDIVETVVLGLLFDVDADDVASASRAKAIFEEVHNSDGEPVSSYNIRINNFDQLWIRIPVNGDIHNFHMLAIPMFAEHSGEEMFKLLLTHC
ncbi:unnamed protein product [Sphagnum troendelagicum]